MSTMVSQFNNGPDQVLPAENLTNTERDGCVKLRIPESGLSIEKTTPTSIPTFVQDRAHRYPNQTAYCYKEAGKWIKVTYRKYLHEIRTCAKAFLSLGLEQHYSVCILGFNSPEWLISNLAAIFAGGIAVGIYSTNSSEACYHCASDSAANIIVVEDEIQLKKIEEIRHRLPRLKAIVQYKGEPKSPGVLSWKNLMSIGEEQNDLKLEEAMKNIAVNQCCTLVYTSGTIGNPKGAMLSHDNLLYDTLALSERIGLEKCSEVIVSYLPLSHIAAQVVDIYLVISCGATLYFADKDALKGSLVNTLKEAQPTRLLAVPRVWEKIHEKMMGVAAQNGYIKTSIASWAKWHGLKHNMDMSKGMPSNTWGYALANAIVFKKVKESLGLSRCKLFISGAAPLSVEVKKYFMSLDILIMDAFGMSESSGGHTLCLPEAFDLGSIGQTIPGFKTKIVNVEHGQGEICLYGRHVFMGYLGDREKTDEAIDGEGWLHSGDVGYIKNGFVYITGRQKELLITAGGENVPPVPIEQKVKAELPFVSQAFLVGDQKKFLSLLVTMRCEVDVDSGRPTDNLDSSTKNWLEKLGCAASTVSDVLKSGPDPKLLKAIQEGIDRVNKTSTSNAQRIQKFTILPADFSIPTGELGPTMKVKRRVVLDKYSSLIDQMYK